MKWIKRLYLIFVFLLCFAVLQQLFMPKYMSAVYEGALINEYYAGAAGHQVLFIGDCEVYENFSPVTLWENYGISSYIRGGPQQLIWQSYYLLEDTLRYEKPDVVVFNVLAMQYNTPQNEAYNRLNIDGMRLSSSKINAARASMTQEESLLSYIFPFFRYHDRWAELSAEDLTYFFTRDKVSFAGFMLRADVKPVTIIPDPPPLLNTQFGETCYEYLDKITQLCENNGIELVLVKAPSLYPHWYDDWDAQMTAYAAQNNLAYINFLELEEEIGLDWQTDTYDAGLHLNVYGAEKLADYFGQILAEQFALADLRGDPAMQQKWQPIVEAYHAMRTAQQAEFAATGKIASFTY